MATNNTKQAVWVSLGSLFSFGFSIVSSMILSRYLDKTDYGTYKQVIYVYHTLLTVFTLGLPKTYSYFLPRVTPEEAKDLINKITKLFFILGGLFSVLLFVGSPVIASVLKNPSLEVALRYFSLVPFFMLPTMGLEGILASYKKTKFLALYTILTRVLMLLCVALPVMAFGLNYIGAIIGFVIASLLSFILAMILKFYPVRGFEKRRTSVTYKEVFQFSLPLLYASLFGVLANSADQFFISRHFGTEIFADFTNGSMELPFIGMIVTACSTVLSPIFSRLSHERVDFLSQVYALWISVYKKTALLIYPIIVYCWVFADVIMVFLYGQQYESSQTFFRIKVITYVFSLIIFAPLLINTGKVKIYSRVHATAAVLIWPIEYIGVLLTDSPYSVSIISLVGHVSKIFIFLYIIAKMFGVRIDQLFPMKLIGKIIIPCLIILAGIKYLILSHLEISTNLCLFISLFLYALCYILYAYLAKLDYGSIIRPLLSKK